MVLLGLAIQHFAIRDVVLVVAVVVLLVVLISVRASLSHLHDTP